MKYSELFKQLKSGVIAPVYLFSGEEKYVMQSALNQLVSLTVDENLKELNLIKLPHNATGEEIVSACETVPFGGEKRGIIVDESDFLQKSSPEGEDRLIEYLESPQNSAVLIFVSPQADKRKKLYKLLQKHTLVEFDTLSDAELIAWCAKELKKRNLSSDREMVQFFCEYTEPRPETMINEIEKLVSYKGSDTDLTRDDIRAIVTPYAEYGIFRMTDALASGGIKTATEILDGLLMQKEDGFYILGAVAKQYRQLLRFKVMTDSGMQKAEILKSLGLREFVYGKYATLCKKYSEKSLRRAVELCALCDGGLKSGGKNPDTALYELAVSLRGLNG